MVHLKSIVKVSKKKKKRPDVFLSSDEKARTVLTEVHVSVQDSESLFASVKS